MKYLQNIGSNSKKAFEKLNQISDKKITSVLKSFNRELLLNKKKIIKERRCIQVNYVTFPTDWKVK